MYRVTMAKETPPVKHITPTKMQDVCDACFATSQPTINYILSAHAHAVGSIVINQQSDPVRLSSSAIIHYLFFITRSHEFFGFSIFLYL